MHTSRLFGTSWLFSLVCVFVLSGCGLISGELKQLLSNGPANVSGISVRATNPNGAYRAGQTISIEVSFPSDVIVTGAPALKLATGRSGAEAIYVSGSGTDTLLFSYTIQSGDNVAELDYLSTAAISEVGGTIKAQTDAPLDLLLSSPGATGSIAHANNIILDTTPPIVTAVTSTTANGAYKAASNISVVATFSEPVFVTGSPELALNSAPSSKAVYQTGSGSAGIRFEYTVGAGHSSTDLDYYDVNSLTVVASSIKDAAGNDALLTLPATAAASSLGGSSAIVIDTDAPSAVSSLDDGFGIIGTTSTPITTWNHATDATSSIATYQIAIGTTPGGTEVLNWTSQTAMSTATVTGLTLTAGTTYYTSVRAVDAAGNVGTGTTGDGWRPVNTLTLAPATKLLVTNERYPFTASEGYPGYTYSVFSGGGSVSGNVFTAPAAAGSSVLRATDLMSSTANANITTRQFGMISSLPPKMVDAVMTVGGAQYDSLGNLYVAGSYNSYTKRWLVKKFDGTTWTTLLDEAGAPINNFVSVTGILVNSSTDIWVIGTKYSSTYEVWTVKHYDGTTWTDSDSFSLAAYESKPHAIAKGPGGEIYVVGDAQAASNNWRWVVRKYSSGTWTTLDNYQRAAGTFMNYARGVAVNSLGEIFVAGGAQPASGSPIDWVVRKYSGGTWTDSDVVGGAAGELATSIAIDSSDNVYVGGNLSGTTNLVRMLSSGTWTSIGEYTEGTYTNEAIERLALDGTGRPYITVRVSKTGGSATVIARYSGSGTTWDLVDTILEMYAPAVTKNSFGELVIAGMYNRLPPGTRGGKEWNIRKTDGTTTTEITSYQERIVARASFTDAAFDSQGNLYVSSYYHIYPGSNYSTWLVNKYDGTTWTEVDEYNPDPTETYSEARSVYIDENDHVWVAGSALVGSAWVWTVRKFDGTSWTTVDTYSPYAGADGKAAAITGKAGNIYVGGTAHNSGNWEDMVIRRFDGTSWSTVYTDDGDRIEGSFTDVIIDSNGVVWAVLTRWTTGWSGQVAEVVKSSDGTTWTVSETLSGGYFENAQLFEGAAGEIYNVFAYDNGSDWVGRIRKWNGSAWSDFDQTPDGSGYSNGVRDSDGNLYFAGYEGSKMMIKKWNGHYFDQVYAPAIQASSTWEALNVLAVGPGGKLLGLGQSKVSTRREEPLAVQLEP